MVIQWRRDPKTVDITMGDLNRQVTLWVRGGRVLDLGGGSGWFLRDVEADMKVVVDLDLDSLGRARIEAVQGDILHLPFRDGTFDAVVARGVLHHVPGHLGRVLDEVRRVLVRGGILFVHDPGGLNPPAMVARRVMPTSIHVPEERPFDPLYLRDAIARRFVIVDERYRHLSGYLLPHLVPRLPAFLRPPARRLSREIVRAESGALRRVGALRRFCGYVQFVGVKDPAPVMGGD